MLQPLSLSFLISSLVCSVLSFSTPNSNVYIQCSQLNFTSTTPNYESTINTLFTSLVELASFRNFAKLETPPQSDVVYGLFQCRGDLTSPSCKECVASSVSKLKTACVMSTGGEIHLERCFVKYNDTSFFGAQGKMEMCKRCGPLAGYDYDVLKRIDDVLAYLVGGNGKYFRGGSFGSIQGVAQCVEDLSLSDCQDCLLEASGRMRSECWASTWGDMYLEKCYIRYADQGNENLANNGYSSSNKNSGGWSKNKILKWIGIIIAVAVGVGITLTCAAKNFCNINVYNKVKRLKKDLEEVKKDAESAKSEAKWANERAEKAEKKTEEESIKSGYTYYGPMSIPSPYTTLFLLFTTFLLESKCNLPT